MAAEKLCHKRTVHSKVTRAIHNEAKYIYIVIPPHYSP